MKLEKEELVLIENWIVDLRKKSIDPIARANIIKKYMLENNLSYKKLEALTGVPHSTLQDWVMWGKITEKEMEKLLDKGMNKKEVYTMLRTNKRVDKQKLIERQAVDFYLEEAISKIGRYERKTKNQAETMVLINRLIDQLNRLKMYMDKNVR